jgi:subtilisin family serine protease
VTRPTLRMAAVMAVLAVALLGSSAVGTSAAGASAASPLVKVIINFRGPARAAAIDVANTVQAAGGEVTRKFQLINAAAAEVPANRLDSLRADPSVASVELDHPLTVMDDPELDASWGVAHIGAGDVHAAGNVGAGIKIGVIDTGIDCNHPDLVGVCAGGYDFYNNDSDPNDDYGHGTAVAGILAAQMNGFGVVGVAPGAQLYAYKVLGADGSGDYSDLIAALQQASMVDHVDIVNMSLGGHDASQALADAVAAAYAQGTILVAASGNVDFNDWNQILYGCPVTYPAAYPQVFATTYTNPDDALTGFSCTGPEVDFAAPGDLINVPVPTGTCALCNSTGYRSDLSGTSFAAPHLAGTVALVLAHGIYNGGDTSTLADDVKAHLCATTTQGFGVLTFPIPPTDPRYAEYFGCGVVNAANALLVDPPPTDGGGSTNQPPVAVDDSATTNQDTAVTVDVLGNDSDPENDPLTVSAVTQPANGTASFTASDVTYTPGAGFNGTDSFDYTVSDGNGGSASATVTVTVTPAVGPTMHVGDLADLSTLQARRWTARVRIRVVDGTGARLSGVVVTGTFSNGKTKSCTTGKKGQCSLGVVRLAKSLPSLTFTVNGLVRSGWTYVPADNTDANGDSDGTTIVLYQP